MLACVSWSAASFPILYISLISLVLVPSFCKEDNTTCRTLPLSHIRSHSLFAIQSIPQLDIMKTIISALLYISVVTALAIPSTEPTSQLQIQAQVVIGKLPYGARPGPEAALPKPQDAEEPVNVLDSPDSCFCTGGTLCCEKNGKTDCGFGVCGI